MARLSAQLNVMRLNAARLNAYAATYRIEINGVVQTGKVRLEGATITHELNHRPDTASFRVSGMMPVAGQRLDFWCGPRDLDHQLFGGRILEVTTLYEGERPALVAYDLACIDPTWLLDRQAVITKYTNQSATAIVLDLVAKFTRGITTTHVVANLPVIPEITFTNEHVSSCFSRIADQIGGYWYVDFAGDLHFFLDEGLTAAPITQTAPRGSRDHHLEEDLSQVATLVVGVGGGGKAVAEVGAGASSIPVDDGVWYLDYGGVVQVGPQWLTYTTIVGTSEAGANTGSIAAPLVAPTLAPHAGSPSDLVAGTYRVAFTWKTEAGQTTVGPSAAITTDATNNWIWVMNMPAPSDPAITHIGIYLSTPNGSDATLTRIELYPYPYVGSFGNDFEIVSRPPAGAPAPPAVNTAGQGTVVIAPGATTFPVDELAPFLASGWAVAPGNQYFRYTGKSAASGPGSLTGIPASGNGSITAPIKAGVVKQVPHLVGIPASGDGAIRFPIAVGDAVNLRVPRYDAAAALAMAERFNIQPITEADGQIQAVLTDGRFAIAELAATVQAYLNDHKTPAQTVTFESRDDTLRIGRTVTLDLTTPAIAGTFRIQRLTFAELGIGQPGSLLRPLRRVDASNRLYTFADVLRRLRDASGIRSAA